MLRNVAISSAKYPFSSKHTTTSKNTQHKPQTKLPGFSPVGGLGDPHEFYVPPRNSCVSPPQNLKIVPPPLIFVDHDKIF